MYDRGPVCPCVRISDTIYGIWRMLVRYRCTMWEGVSEHRILETHSSEFCSGPLLVTMRKCARCP